MKVAIIISLLLLALVLSVIKWNMVMGEIDQRCGEVKVVPG